MILKLRLLGTFRKFYPMLPKRLQIVPLLTTLSQLLHASLRSRVAVPDGFETKRIISKLLHILAALDHLRVANVVMGERVTHRVSFNRNINATTK